ncbi:hypothetical protein H8699_02115 [Christensenellaceae bacterium NSJ-44]|uniref:N4-gp56 family major capsid protein n=1 Tax=Luoshenia tenuis TaxID=2763654 RepID=A0A926CYD7_9FIRM|nr:N4-gp56 family major capsid protein [Luoshenia tenuis]MBC8528234.1 hypothetical protein [Luoshenia tenuis]
MAITLHDKYAKQISTMFTTQSLISGLLSNEYDWSGVKTVKVMTPQTVPMNDYTRTGANRYGSPVEMQDIVQEMTLTQDKSFALTIDKGNNADQNGLKAAGKMLKLQLAERAVPTMDKYVFEQLAQLAGTVVGNSTALAKNTVCDRISEGTQVLDDGEVPQEGRTLFVSNATYKLLKHSDEFLGIDKLGEKALAKGQVGEYDNMKVVKVPSGRWPANVNFMIVYKNSATAPVKLNDTRVHQDPPGISGNLLEGRQYYDCFVFGPKAVGIYVEVNTGSGKGTVCSGPSIAEATGAITVGTTGATVKYTTDGTDPRYSNTAKVGTQADVTGEGVVVKAYEYKAGCYPSVVEEATLTA